MRVCDAGFPGVLSRLRREAGLTQAGLAEKARVSRRTIIRWEAGTASPWIPELKAVLLTLQASEADTDDILKSLDTPRAERASGSVPRSVLGRAMRAMRLRTGLSATLLGKRLGYDGSTVHRWERGAWRAGPDTMKAFFEAVSAHPAEIEWVNSSSADLGRYDAIEVEEELGGIVWPWDPLGCILSDVRFISLMDRLEEWSQSESDAARSLVLVGLAYSRMLLNCRRLDEALSQSLAGHERCERLGGAHVGLVHAAALLNARVHCHQRNATLRSRGIEMLDWLAKHPLDLEDYSLRMISYAEAFARQGDFDKAMAYGDESIAALLRRGLKPSRERCLDRARVNLQCGRPNLAIQGLSAIGEGSPTETALEAVVLSEAFAALGRPADADHWQSVAVREIDAYSLQRWFPEFARRDTSSPVSEPQAMRTPNFHVNS